MPANSTQSSDLKLEEMARILDVAAELRVQRTQATEQLSRPVIKADLRQRLLAAASVSGDRVSGEEIDAAIEQYFDNLHAYREPRRGMATMLAHLYVRRIWVYGFIFVAAVIATFLGFTLWF